MIANFTNIVDVPSQAVPTEPGDLERCIIGRPGSAVHLILTHRNGTEFWIGKGVIYRYSSPGSFFSLQDPGLLPEFTGTTSLTSNDVVQIAEKALRKLAKRGNPLENGPPKVQQASEYRGRQIPFFRVSWPKAGPGDAVAQVEIDGRTGRIVCLDLRGDGFTDLALDEEIRKRVNAPEVTPTPKRQPYWLNYPKPTSEEAVKAIDGWLAFCKVLRLDPGAQTNLADIDWSSSWLAQTPSRSLWSNGVCVAQACHIRFKSGACFDSAGGVASSYFSADGAFYLGNDYRPSGAWGPFEGTPTKKWQDLAKELEARIIERLGTPRSFIERLRTRRKSPAEDPPGHPVRRAFVVWRMLPPKPDAAAVSTEERYLLQICGVGKFGFPVESSAGLSPDERAFAKAYWPSKEPRWQAAAEEALFGRMVDLLIAEFDLQTGEVKGLEFCYPQMFWPSLRSLPSVEQ